MNPGIASVAAFWLLVVIIGCLIVYVPAVWIAGLVLVTIISLVIYAVAMYPT